MHIKRSLLLMIMLLMMVFLGALLPLDQGLAATYYVDQASPSASDSNPGTSQTAPWLTLERAMSIVAGDTVLVKDGIYTTTTGFQARNSGTVGAPITFRAYPGNRPELRKPLPCVDDTGMNVNCGTIVVAGVNYIVWDGFYLGTRMDIYLINSNHVTFQNLLIDKGPIPSTGGIGNYNGMFIQGTTGTIIQNNIIRNVYYTADNHTNGASIVLYDTFQTMIRNNEIYNSNAAISDKRNGVSNVYERNYLHDLYAVGIIIGRPIEPQCGTCPVQDDAARYNVMVNVPLGVNFNMDTTVNPGADLQVYNNTFYNVYQGVRSGGIFPGTALYNNIIAISGADSRSSAYLYYSLPSPTPPGQLLDFSDFRAPSDPQGRFLADEFGSYETLAQWQSRGFDLNSRAVDPLFVGPLTGTPPPVAGFKLQPTSPLINAGRVGGVSSGSPVNMGAYLSNSDVIGPGAVSDTLPPSGPTNLRVQ